LWRQNSSGTLERLFTQITGGSELERRAEDFAKTFRSMSAPEVMPVHTPVLSQEKTLRRLFLMLFLRGRSSRGLNKDKAPKSVGSKLGLSLFFYGLFGVFISLTFLGKPVFPLSLYMHAMTLVFLECLWLDPREGCSQHRGGGHFDAPSCDSARFIAGQNQRAGDGVVVAGRSLQSGGILRRCRCQQWRLAFSHGPRPIDNHGGAVLHRLCSDDLPALPQVVRARAAGRPHDDGHRCWLQSPPWSAGNSSRT